MTGKEAGRRTASHWRTFLSLAGGSIGVLALCLAARGLFGPGTATAQVPGRQIVPARNTAPQSPAAAPNGAPATQPAAQPANQPAAPATGQAAAQPQVMAVVNTEQVTRQFLGNECLRRYGEEVLETIVNKHLILQACQKYNIVVTEQDVENEIKDMASKFGLSPDRWLTMLERERDIPPEQYRREIIWPTLALRRLASEQTTVSDVEIKQALESEYGAKVKVRMISVGSQQKAEDVRRRALAEPAKFGELAKEVSEDPVSAAARGVVPAIRKHGGHPEVEQVAFALKEGEVSRIIPIANQFLILQCEKHLPESYVSSTNLDAIQTQLRDQIRDQKLRDAAGGIFQKMQAEAKVVNVFNDPARRQQMPGVAALINDRQITLQQLTEECLARHGKEVLDGEINRMVLVQELKRRSKTVGDAAIDAEVARAAESYGYLKKDGTPDVDTWIKTVTETDNVTVDLYIRDAVWPSVALKQLVGEQIQVTEDDLQKGFESNYGERVEVLAIVLSNQRQANEVWDMARNNPTDQFFGDLAQQYSMEAVSRANFGKVPPIRKHGGQPVIEEEAFGMKPGDLSAILNVGDKFVILRCLGRTEPVVQDFQVVRNELFKDIHEKKLRIAMAQEFDRLKEIAQIDNFLARTSQAGRGVNAAANPPRSGVAPTTFESAAPTTRR